MIANLSEYTKVGPQMNGYNPAGQYEHNGARYYVKGTTLADEHTLARVQNEVLAGKLMRAAGAGAADTHLIEGLPAYMGGGVGLASRFVTGSNVFPITPAALQAVQTDFAVHAWLANYDVIGGWLNNTLIVGGSACNIDAGGALLFRARGKIKYTGLPFGAMPTDVTEWNTMRDLRMNGPAAQFYGSMSTSALRHSGSKVGSVRNETIAELIGAHGFGDNDVRSRLTASLIARRETILALIAG